MVFGSILNWIVGKSLDITFDSIWWVTKKTGQGLLNAGYYIVITRNQNDKDKNKDKENKEKNENIIMDEINNDLICLSKEEFIAIKEQNELLKEEIKLLHNS
jgi:hypothetical protein